MTVLSDARTHLRKAREFLDASEMSLELGLFNAAASNAVTSGINAKDAICLALTGKTAKSDDHRNAVSELRQAGLSTRPLASTLERLLKLKTRSQYQAADISRTDAAKSVEWAASLMNGARSIVPR